MLNSLKILIEQPEYSALIHLSEREMRTSADQVRLILRQELVRRGLLQDTLPNLNQPQGGSFTEPKTNAGRRTIKLGEGLWMYCVTTKPIRRCEENGQEIGGLIWIWFSVVPWEHREMQVMCV